MTKINFTYLILNMAARKFIVTYVALIFILKKLLQKLGVKICLLFWMDCGS